MEEGIARGRLDGFEGTEHKNTISITYRLFILHQYFNSLAESPCAQSISIGGREYSVRWCTVVCVWIFCQCHYCSTARLVWCFPHLLGHAICWFVMGTETESMDRMRKRGARGGRDEHKHRKAANIGWQRRRTDVVDEWVLCTERDTSPKMCHLAKWKL